MCSANVGNSVSNWPMMTSNIANENLKYTSHDFNGRRSIKFSSHVSEIFFGVYFIEEIHLGRGGPSLKIQGVHFESEA